MRLPGPTSVLFLVWLLALMPAAAVQSARALQEGRADPARYLPSRETIWARTTVILILLLAFAWYTGRGFDFRPFAAPPLGSADALAAIATLAIYLGLRGVSGAIRSDAERRAMPAYLLVPRTAREWLRWTVTVLVASVAEEVAYRGVGMAILSDLFGSPWLAAGICAVAFALAHWTQGWKSALLIFLMALAAHGLVAVTGTLVLAMLVHAVYDVLAGYLLADEARRLGVEAASG